MQWLGREMRVFKKMSGQNHEVWLRVFIGEEWYVAVRLMSKYGLVFSCVAEAWCKSQLGKETRVQSLHIVSCTIEHLMT